LDDDGGALLEMETHPLYNDAKIIILSQSKLNLGINNYLYTCVELVL